MSDFLIDVQSSPVAPAAGQVIIYADSSSKLLTTKDENGYIRTVGQSNFSTIAQIVPAAIRTYIAGSQVAVPSGKLQIGSCFRWRFNITKTAAGVAASTYDIAIGLTGTIADVARLSFVKPAGTATVDEGWVEISMVVRGPLSALGVCVGQFVLSHNLAATGHTILPGVAVNTVSAPFDITPAGLIVGLCLTSGAADAITTQLVQTEAWNL